VQETISCTLFYVQDVRYVAGAWMRKSDHVHDYRDVGGRATQEQLPRMYGRKRLLGNCSCIALISYIHVAMQFRHFRHPWRSYVAGASILISYRDVGKERGHDHDHIARIVPQGFFSILPLKAMRVRFLKDNDGVFKCHSKGKKIL